ncbi:MAG TPA: FxLYD domain-containing protein [Anaerolineae bacterium]|nr:FxLYD domain-containing protein [Anaerolineae bacterium]HMR62797.1 FxLYD domain-containing protein [Anaerolineae bacterium]
MRNSRSFWTGILLGGTIFFLCNVAGYLLVNTWGPIYLRTNRPLTQTATAGPTLEVVIFSTPTAAMLESVPTVSIAPGTPAPLLPTVTPGLPPPEASPIASIPAETPTPTVLARADRAATKARIDVSGKLEVLSHRTYIDELGWHHIVGEVQNNADIPLEYVEVVAKLYDVDGEEIGTKLTFTEPDVIYPGGKAPFDLVTIRRSQWKFIDDYILQVKGDAASELINENLVLLNQNSWIEGDFLYVSGEVQNTGSTPALVKLVVTLYDANLNVINTNWSYADRGILMTSDTSSFLVKFSHEVDPDNYSYRIQIEEEAVQGED